MKKDIELYEFRIPIRKVEGKYGSGNFDDAGDEISEGLNLVTRLRGGFNIEYFFEDSHENPWYHNFCFRIEGLDESEKKKFEAFLEERQIEVL